MTACRAAATGASRTEARAGSEPGTTLLHNCSQRARTAPTASFGIAVRKAGWSSNGWPTPLSPQSSNVKARPVAAKIAGMEIAVDQRVSEDRNRPPRRTGGEARARTQPGLRDPLGELVLRPLDGCSDRGCKRGCAPVRQPEREQLGLAVDPAPLEVHEQAHHVLQQRSLSIVQVLAGDSRPAACDSRHGRAPLARASLPGARAGALRGRRNAERL